MNNIADGVPHQNDDTVESLKKLEDAKNLVEPLVEKVDAQKPVKTDKEFEESKNDAYSSILKDCADSIHSTLKWKKIYKLVTYIVVSLILVAITGMLIYEILKYDKYGMTDWLAVVIPLIISFLTVFIVIPQIITNYVFDKDENAHIVELLKIVINSEKK